MRELISITMPVEIWQKIQSSIAIEDWHKVQVKPDTQVEEWLNMNKAIEEIRIHLKIKEPEPHPEYLNLKQFAEQLNVNPSTVIRYINNGILHEGVHFIVLENKYRTIRRFIPNSFKPKQAA